MRDKKLKAEWVAALRSGDYKQGRGALCKHDRYCCLGVLYDIAHDGDWHEHADGVWTIDPIISAEAPAGFTESYGNSLGVEIEPLMNMNDGGCSFSEIADYIEEHE